MYLCLFVSAVYFVNGGPPSQLHDGSTRVSPSKTQRQGSPEEARTTLNPPLLGPEGFSWKAPSAPGFVILFASPQMIKSRQNHR